ncbi:MAG: anthranilate phosphoribosyltransferase [Bowdeniella nasicola]|nr:anthranilate phosphoribosyltransferase [Bowdeniella nasicola]
MTTSTPTWPALLTDLIAGRDLTYAETSWAMDRIMNDEVSPVLLAAFLVGLATKGESVAELRALADTMLEHSTPIEVGSGAVDIVGTGGDRAKTVNISTMAALVIAGAGVPVAKHGNRASSSASGSADVLEQLGVDLNLPVARVAEAYEQVGITFFFATVFHPSMRFAAPTRRELGVGTAFNVLGPLTNPARPAACAIGVASERHAPLVAGVLAERGTHALVFRGANGLDELTSTARNQVWQVCDGTVRYEEFDATDLGLAPSTIDDLRGEDAVYNADVARRVFAGEDDIVAQTVALNAAAGLFAHAGARGPLVEGLATHYAKARETLSSGAAQSVLDAWVRFSAR